MIKFPIGIVLTSIFFLLSILHIYWGIGGNWGKDLSVPTRLDHSKVINPGPLDCFVVAAGLFLFAALVLIKAELFYNFLPTRIVYIGLRLVAIVFIFRAVGEFKFIGFFKTVVGTPFANMDTYYYSPLCLLIGILIILLEVY